MADGIDTCYKGNDLTVTALDNCPTDPDKTDPGYCGCGIPETDSDSDGIPDCEEQGPSGNDPNYDGNGDGTADNQQANVTSLHTYDNQDYVTMESPTGTTISNCQAADNPSASNANPNLSGMKALAVGLPQPEVPYLSPISINITPSLVSVLITS